METKRILDEISEAISILESQLDEDFDSRPDAPQWGRLG